MNDIDIRFYLSLLLRRLPYILAISITATLAGIALAYILPPLYRADAKILVEDPQIPTEMARSTVPTIAFAQFQIIGQEVTTQDYLTQLAARLNVYADSEVRLSSAEIADDMRSRIRLEQVELDGASPGSGATVFRVSFDARKPQLAADVVNDLVTYILGKNRRLRTDRAGDTLQFFEKEVARLGSELTTLDAEILKFKNNNQEALPDSLDFRRNQQNAQQERLAQIEREEAGLRSRRNNLVQIYSTTGQAANTGPLTPDQQMLQDLNRALVEQLATFSETSPTVLALRAQISSVQRRIQDNKPTDSSGKAAPSEYELQMSDIDERLSFITQERQSIAKNLVDLAKSIDATPANESALNSLERNRTNIQAQYNNATAMLAQASTGEQIESASKGGGRFSLVEPAVAPEKPVSPNRLRIAALGLVAGIGLGIGFVVLLELMNKTIRRPSELVEILDIQPLATIPYIALASEKRSRRVGFAQSAAALCAMWMPAHGLLAAAGKTLALLNPGRLLG
ncbi:GumC family protein [Mesorhizobium sp. BH1-1-4]|uniref:GumC family protein n=1 Tax=Mesorhizobium sp. BH1-1-4 TaxID=2876662 RepID=UPI001CD171A2|nr:Wzz/FepE/Etk N-terminal domain-containing protein [Mesorhizobium sp. BH1-1-4]MBZ9993100.1 lipopolysaccharide biosynthesis protein [Mesorhizobium sp. BH1-1-4]